VLNSIVEERETVPAAQESAAPAPAAYIDHWVRTQSLPTLIVTPQLRVLWTNDAAEQLLEERDDLHLASDHLMLGDARRTDAFRERIAGLDTTPIALVHRRRMAESHFIIRIDRLAMADAAAAYVLVLHSSTASDRYLWSDFGPVFSLTRSEVGIVKQLLAGNSAEQIAQTLCISLDTVRTHIKRVYTKSGVSSREQLFQAVLPFRLG